MRALVLRRQGHAGRDRDRAPHGYEARATQRTTTEDPGPAGASTLTPFETVLPDARGPTSDGGIERRGSVNELTAVALTAVLVSRCGDIRTRS
jgi:hypothetical protein